LGATGPPYRLETTTGTVVETAASDGTMGAAETASSFCAANAEGITAGSGQHDGFAGAFAGVFAVGVPWQQACAATTAFGNVMQAIERSPAHAPSRQLLLPTRNSTSEATSVAVRDGP
jgi:type IV secretory pathway TrbL component